MNRNETQLVLASASPRRKDLLSGIGLSFRIVPSEVDEEPINGESPDAQVCRLALAKASDVSEKMSDYWVLGADTIVVIDNAILGKPRNEEEAVAMLARLSGRTHEVFTGYAIVHAKFSEQRTVRYVTSAVHIRDMSADEISDYVSTREPMDKAGAYAIQGIGAGIVERVTGSYTNVVGLPLCEVTRDLKTLGIFDFLKANRRS
jgi:nucleoside triphosphate pyrophosphatase